MTIPILWLGFASSVLRPIARTVGSAASPAAGVLNPPEMPRVPWADVIAGYQATLAALDALREREHAQAAGKDGAVHRRVGLNQGVDDAAEWLQFAKQHDLPLSAVENTEDVF